MSKNIFIGVFCLIIGIGVGFIIFSNNLKNNSETPVGSMSEMNMNAFHTMLEVDTTSPIPSVKVEVFKDTKDGYNLHLLTENYRLTPEKVNNEPVQGEGHAHVYVNDVKVARLYGDWFNLPSSEFKDGENMIEVTLNANDHSEWAKNGQHISDTTTVIK